MSYFSEQYPSVRYPLASAHVPGLRTAQLGALHAIGAHFSIRNDPALVCFADRGRKDPIGSQPRTLPLPGNTSTYHRARKTCSESNR